MSSKIIYLDNAATTCPTDNVMSAMQSSMTQYFGNPSSLHRLGVEAAQHLEECRRQIALSLHVSADSIIFTSGATEANQTVLKCGIHKPNKKRNHILISSIEHNSISKSIVELQEAGFEVELLTPDCHGTIDPMALAQKIRPTTELVSIIAIHNELGTIQDLVGLKKMIHSVNPQCLFHTDGVQLVGKYELPPTEWLPDYITFSGHKLHAPRGTGGIIKKAQTPLKPLINGGGQERRFRSGTENVAAIAGLACAIKEGLPINKAYLQHLQKKIYEYCLQHPKIKWIGHPPGPQKSVFINLFAIKGGKSEVLIHQLEEQNIYISSGSACSEKAGKSHQSWAFTQLPSEYLDGVLRATFSKYTTTEEIDAFLLALEKVIPK